jgi:sorbitol/mannitol transport system substrate-binding protein
MANRYQSTLESKGVSYKRQWTFFATCVAVLFFSAGVLQAFGAEKVSIKFAFEAGRQAEAAQYLMDSWNATHPQISVEIVPLPYDARDVRERTMLAAHSSEIDGFSHVELNEFGPAGWLLPLDKYLAKQPDYFLDFFDKHVVRCKLPEGVSDKLPANLRGTWYGVPYDSAVMILFYRTDLYDKYGLARPDKNKGLSWDEFVRNVKALNKPAQNLYGTALAGMKGSQQWMRVESLAVSFGGEPVMDRNNKPVLNTAPWLKAIQGYKDLLDNYSPPGVKEYNFSEQNTAFAQGIVAHMVQWMVAINTVEDPKSSKVAGKVGYGVFPGGGLSSGNSWFLSINAFTKNPDATWEFLDFLNNKKNAATQSLLFSDDMIRKSTFSDPRFLEKFPEASSMLKALQGTFDRLPNIPQAGEISNVMATEVNNAMVGLKTPSQALQSAQESIAKIMEQ